MEPVVWRGSDDLVPLGRHGKAGKCVDHVWVVRGRVCRDIRRELGDCMVSAGHFHGWSIDQGPKARDEHGHEPEWTDALA